MNRRCVLAILIGLNLAGVSVWAADTQGLGDKNEKVRLDAQAKLIEQKAAAIPALIKTLDGDDATAGKMAEQALFEIFQKAAGTSDQHRVVVSLIALLDSPGNPKGNPKAKQVICRALGYLPERDAVAALDKVYDDANLAEAAREGLIRNPDKSATHALLARLGKGDDAAKSSIIQALGQRGDGAAVPALVEQTASKSEAVSKAAWHALAQIPSAEAVPAFTKAVTENKNAVATAELLDFADVLVRAGKLGEADKMAKLRKQAGPLDTQDKCKMLRVHARLGTPESISLVMKGLDDSDAKIRGAALAAASILPSPDFTQALTEKMNASKGQAKLDLLEVLGKRGKQFDDRTVMLMYMAMIDADENVRIACIHAMKAAGITSTAPTLINFVRGKPGPVADAAEDALVHIPGDTLTRQIGDALAAPNGPGKVRLVHILGERKDKMAMPAIERATADANPEVRAAAYQAMVALAGEGAYDKLLAAFERGGPERDGAEKAMMSLTSELITAKLLASYFDVADAAKPSILRVLTPRKMDTIDALLNSESTSTDKAIREAALAGMAERAKAASKPAPK